MDIPNLTTTIVEKLITIQTTANLKSRCFRNKYCHQIIKKIQIQSDDAEKNGIVRMLDSFIFRHHFVIVFELLDINLCTWMYDKEVEQYQKVSALKMIAT